MDDLEKRGLIAVAIALGILLLWGWIFTPQAPPAPVAAGEPGPVAGPVVPEGGEAGATDPEAAPSGPIEAIGAAAEAETVVRTDRYELRLTNRGGRIVSWKLLDYANDEGEPVELVPPDAVDLDRLPLSLWVPGREDLARAADAALFEVAREDLPAEGGPGRVRLSMRYAEPSGFAVEKTLELAHGSYFAEVRASLREGGRPHEAWLVWGAGFGETAEGKDLRHDRFRPVGQAVVDWGGRVRRYPKGEHDDVTPMRGDLDLRWAGMETTYFAALMVPGGPSREVALIPAVQNRPPPAGGKAEPEEVRYLSIAVAPGPDGAFELFVGPKQYRMLRDHGQDLQAVINFGWPVVREIAAGLFLALTWTYGYVHNYGVAILMLTFAIRLGFFPLMYRTQIKMRQTQHKMKRVQPKMKAIRERYHKRGIDMQGRQKMNEEIMALYKKEGVNPLGGIGGCLPLLLQLPFLYGFYQLLSVTIELRQAPFFGWIRDLSRPDPYWVTPLLMGASMLVQTKISMSAGVDPTQRRMMSLMSVVFTVFFLNLPSGLVLYWLFSNVLGIGQQVLVNRRADHELEMQKPQKGRKNRNADPSGEKGERTNARAASRP
jgi:YidC/Oxa1 family membrane protein insertase